jgi:hypothetical protein
MTSSLDFPWRRDARRGDDRETMRETKREQSETGDGARARVRGASVDERARARIAMMHE